MNIPNILVLYIFYTALRVAIATATDTEPKECISIKIDDFSTCPNLHELIDKHVGEDRIIPTCNNMTGTNQTGNNTSKGNIVTTTSRPSTSSGGNPGGGSGTIQTLLKAPVVAARCPVQGVCNKTFRLTSIDHFPFLDTTRNMIMIILRYCCGTCFKPCLVEKMKDISELNEKKLAESDIVFPIFGRTLTTKQYGFYYIPMIDIPYSYYIRKATTHEDVMASMLSDFGALWPLLIICLIFAITAGFIIWLLDTWMNEEEFPRKFLLGWFEGFWWSFISMTTVGYGDKAPKSRLARLFSVGWILIGKLVFFVVFSLLGMTRFCHSIASIDKLFHF